MYARRDNDVFSRPDENFHPNAAQIVRDYNLPLTGRNIRAMETKTKAVAGRVSQGVAVEIRVTNLEDLHSAPVVIKVVHVEKNIGRKWNQPDVIMVALERPSPFLDGGFQTPFDGPLGAFAGIHAPFGVRWITRMNKPLYFQEVINLIRSGPAIEPSGGG
jgi:hypothetical protein